MIQTTTGGTIITGKENINVFRLLTLKGALKMEIAGMKRRGRSVYAIVKEEFGFKGSKQKVYDQLVAYIEEAKTAREAGE